MKDVEGYERSRRNSNLLAAGDRREIVHALRQQATGETTVDDLAELLATDGRVTENDSERPSITLYPVNLPKLDDYGFVELDRERRPVRYQPNVHVDRLMDSLPQSGGPTTGSGSSD
jgi:hypothetical protein